MSNSLLNEEHRNNVMHFANLFSLACVDGEPTPEEFEILERFAKKLGVTEEEVKDVWESPEEYRIGKLKSRTNRLKFVYDFFRIIYADSILEESEYLLVKQYITAMGFDNIETDIIINKTISIFERDIDIDDYELMIFGIK